MMWLTVQVRSTTKMKLNSYDRYDRVQFMPKTRQDDMINHTSVVYAEIRIELSWLIGQDAVYHEK